MLEAKLKWVARKAAEKKAKQEKEARVAEERAY